MGRPFWEVEGGGVGGREVGSEPGAERWAGSEVQHDVVDPARRATDRLRLGIWGYLVMHASQSASPRVVGDAGLLDRRRKTRRGHFVLRPNTGKETARIGDELWLDDEKAWDGCRHKPHAAVLNGRHPRRTRRAVPSTADTNPRLRQAPPRERAEASTR